MHAGLACAAAALPPITRRHAVIRESDKTLVTIMAPYVYAQSGHSGYARAKPPDSPGLRTRRHRLDCVSRPAGSPARRLRALRAGSRDRRRQASRALAGQCRAATSFTRGLHQTTARSRPRQGPAGPKSGPGPGRAHRRAPGLPARALGGEARRLPVPPAGTHDLDQQNVVSSYPFTHLEKQAMTPTEVRSQTAGGRQISWHQHGNGRSTLRAVIIVLLIRPHP
jgi:hypothetical protein